MKPSKLKLLLIHTMTMFNSLRGRQLSCLLALALTCLVVISGCGGSKETAQVKGKVTYKDGSIPQGGVRAVRFEPAADTTAKIRKGASGNIGPDGSFEMYTRKPGDGVNLGKYVVTFAVWKGPMDQTSLILEKYANASSSPYSVEVTGDIDDLKYEIEPLPGAAATKAAP